MVFLRKRRKELHCKLNKAHCHRPRKPLCYGPTLCHRPRRGFLHQEQLLLSIQLIYLALLTIHFIRSISFISAFTSRAGFSTISSPGASSRLHISRTLSSIGIPSRPCEPKGVTNPLCRAPPPHSYLWGICKPQPATNIACRATLLSLIDILRLSNLASAQSPLPAQTISAATSTHTGDERLFIYTVYGKALAGLHDKECHKGFHLHAGEKNFLCKRELGAGG